MLMFNMFVIVLEPFKSHCYFLFIYHLKKYGSSKSKLTYFRNRDIVYAYMKLLLLRLHASISDEIGDHVMPAFSVF